MTDEVVSGHEALLRAVGELSPQRRALLERRLARQRTGGQPAIQPVPRPAGICRFPASLGQERLYYLHQLAPESTAYLMPVVLRLKGRLHGDALRAALSAMVDRHESLRTGFELDGQRGLTQVVRPAVDVEWLLEDVCAEEIPDRIARLRRPFDLASAPLLRAALWTVREPGSAPARVLALCVHHIVVDGWSSGVLVDDLIEEYTAAVSGRPSALPDLPLQYVDFAAWQNDWLASEGPDEQLAYWRRALAGARGLTVPGDRPQRADQSFDGSSVRLNLPAELAADLSRLGRSEQATLYMVLLAAFVVVLHRWSGQEDVVVGAPVAGRARPELERLVGLFINMIPLRIGLEGLDTFRDLLRRARAICLDGYAHQDVPFERVMAEVDGERRGGRSALVKVMLALHNVPVGTMRLPDVEAEVLEQPRGGADFDLTLALAHAESGGLRGWLVYSRDLFDPETAARIVEALREVLSAIAADGDLPLWALPAMASRQHHHLVTELSGAAVPGCPARCLLDWFQAHLHDHLQAHPRAVGAHDGLTLVELDERANQLAHWLLRQGVNVEDRIAVHVPPGPDLAWAILGVLKAGAAWVPLASGLAAERVERLVRVCRPRLVLTVAALVDELPTQAPVEVVAIDGLVLREPTVRPDVVVSSLNVACVLAVDGFGAAMLTHHGLSNVASTLDIAEGGILQAFVAMEASVNAAHHAPPAPGVELYVLDRAGRVQPIGVAGELHVGGVQLARGYLDRPGRTADRFRPHPFHAGQRLCRTGERARWRSDGVVEFLDRMGQEAKVAAGKTDEVRARGVPPTDDLQEVLAGIWAESLDVPDVGVHDDFFDLGGHSLLATLVVAQIRDLFQVELPMYFFVDAPTVSALATLVRELGAREGVDIDQVAALVLQVRRMPATEVESRLRSTVTSTEVESRLREPYWS